MRAVILAVLALPALASGCDNSCQQVCDRMAKYAEECGLPVSRDDISACKDAQAGKESRDDRAFCREFNGQKIIEEEWDCNDLRAYWSGVEGQTPDGDAGEEQ